MIWRSTPERWRADRAYDPTKPLFELESMRRLMKVGAWQGCCLDRYSAVVERRGSGKP